MTDRLPLAVVIPVYADWQPLVRLLAELGPLAYATVVVSVDPPPPSLAVEIPAGIRQLQATVAGRGEQLAQGVAAVSAEWYWLLHADSRIGTDCSAQLQALIRHGQPTWGRFNVCLEPGRPALNLVAFFMNLRSRLTAICTGDQGLFVHASLLQKAGGVPRQPLMEDIELSARLRRHARPVVLPGPLGTSARRWDRDGVLRTILSMWRFRLRYWLGASPTQLAADYYQRQPATAAKTKSTQAADTGSGTEEPANAKKERHQS